MLKQKAREYLEHYCDELQDETKLGGVWRMTKTMKGTSSNSSIPSLRVVAAGQIQTLKKPKCSLKHIRKIAATTTTAPLSSSTKQCVKLIQILQKNIKPCSDSISNPMDEEFSNPMDKEFSMHELKAALAEWKKSSAPGDDQIHYEMLKNMQHSSQQKL